MSDTPIDPTPVLEKDRSEGGTAQGAAAPADPAGVGLRETSLEALQARSGQPGQPPVAVLGRGAQGDGGGGSYLWDDRDLSTEVAADPARGVYVAPSRNASGSSGAWVRSDYSPAGPVKVQWFGAAAVARRQGASDAAPALQAAIDFVGDGGQGPIAETDGGGVVLLPAGFVELARRVTVPPHVSLRGDSTSKSILVCANPDAGIVFTGDVFAGTASRGGSSGEFLIDGNGVATSPLTIGRAVTRSFSHIHVCNSAGDGLVLDQCQNSSFIECSATGNAGNGLVLDNGSSHNTFVSGSFSGNGRHNLVFRQTNSALIGNPETPKNLEEPGNNRFIGGLFEYDKGGTQTVYHGAGRDNAFVCCSFYLGGSGGPASMFVLKADTADGKRRVSRDLTLDNCVIQGRSNLVIFDLADDFILNLTGTLRVGNADTLIRSQDGCRVNCDSLRLNNVTHLFANPDGSQSFSHVVDTARYGRSIVRVDQANEGALGIQVEGEGHFRWRMLASGRMVWLDANGHERVELQRAHSGARAGLTVSGRVYAEGGLGVGNHAAAGALGRVTGSVEVFDASGASLGFLPVYDRIT